MLDKLRCIPFIVAALAVLAVFMGAARNEGPEPEAYVLMEADTRSVLNEKNADKRLNAGYLSKLMGILLIAEDMILRNAMLLLHGKLYLYENGVYKQDEDDILCKDIVKQYIYPELVTDQRLNRVIKLLKAEKSIKTEDSEINKYPKHWICFKNGFLDLKTLEMHPHDPKYKNIALIPPRRNSA